MENPFLKSGTGEVNPFLKSAPAENPAIVPPKNPFLDFNTPPPQEANPFLNLPKAAEKQPEINPYLYELFPEMQPLLQKKPLEVAKEIITAEKESVQNLAGGLISLAPGGLAGLVGGLYRLVYGATTDKGVDSLAVAQEAEKWQKAVAKAFSVEPTTRTSETVMKWTAGAFDLVHKYSGQLVGDLIYKNTDELLNHIMPAKASKEVAAATATVGSTITEFAVYSLVFGGVKEGPSVARAWAASRRPNMEIALGIMGRQRPGIREIANDVLAETREMIAKGELPDQQQKRVATPEPSPAPTAKAEQAPPKVPATAEEAQAIVAANMPAPVAEKVKPEILTGLNKDVLASVREEVIDGTPGKRYKGGGEPSTYPTFMNNKGWSRAEVLSAMNKAMEDKPLTPRQQEIVRKAEVYGKEIDAELPRVYGGEQVAGPAVMPTPKTEMIQPEQALPIGPGAKTMGAKEVPPTMMQLGQHLENLTTPKQSLGERVRMGERIAGRLSQGKDTATQAVETMKGAAAATWDYYRRPPKWTEFKEILGKYLGGRTKSSLYASRFAKAIQKVLPGERQEAITNWIEASGDANVLRQRATQSKGLLKRGYESALNLTPDEVNLARNIKSYFEAMLDRAIEEGVLDHGVEDYVNHVWRRQPMVAKKILAEVNAGLLRKNPSFAKQRIFESYFEGEQAGFTPKDKRIGYLVSAYEQSFNEAILARAFIKSLLEGNAEDGRPLVSVSGAGKQILAEKGNVSAEPKGYIVRPRVLPEETADYRYLDHPALRKWKWATKDAEGKPIFVEGNMMVHPDIYNKRYGYFGGTSLKNILGRSAIQQIPVLRTILKGVQTLKGTLLSLSGFHQVQEGTHAIFHKVNAFKVPEINLEDMKQMDLVEHGLMVHDKSGLIHFSEGVYSGGLLNRVPGLGRLLQKYGEYLFEDYIPRLKMKMALDAFERNTKRYEGKFSKDQILELTANQANAAFGELNYKWMGRNQTMQDIMRLITLAPDFLEARGKFAAQALKPGGREQMAALVRGAAGMYVTARILNYMFSDGNDPHWNRPFSVVIHGREYALRSVPGDLYHLVRDPRSFIYHRLNPSITKPLIEGLTGRDIFGRKRDFGQKVQDYFTGHIPIPAQGLVTKREQTLWDSVLSSMGVSSFTHRTSAEQEARDLVRAKYVGIQATDADKLDAEYRIIKMIHEGDQAGADALMEKSVEKGLFSKRDKHHIQQAGREGPLLTDIRRLSIAETVQVWKKASAEERALIEPVLRKKRRNFQGSPRERAELNQLLEKVLK